MTFLTPFDRNTEVFEFNHIPKTAGTSVHKWLEVMLDGKYTLCAPNTGWEKVIATVHGAGGHQMRGGNPINKRKERVVRRMIVLRDPLQRFTSFYKHIKDHPNHHLARRPGVHAMSLVEFALYCEAEGQEEFSNLQARFVAGGGRRDLNIGDLKTQLREAFVIAAPASQTSRLFTVMAVYFGFQGPQPPRANVSKPRLIDPAEIEEIAPIIYRNNILDLQLYCYCQDLFIDLFDGYLTR